MTRPITADWPCPNRKRIALPVWNAIAMFSPALTNPLALTSSVYLQPYSFVFRNQE